MAQGQKSHSAYLPGHRETNLPSIIPIVCFPQMPDPRTVGANECHTIFAMSLIGLSNSWPSRPTASGISLSSQKCMQFTHLA